MESPQFAEAQAAKSQPLAHHGEFGNGRADESRVDKIKSTEGGTSQAYLLRRIARDNPQLYDPVQLGPRNLSPRICLPRR